MLFEDGWKNRRPMARAQCRNWERWIPDWPDASVVLVVYSS